MSNARSTGGKERRSIRKPGASWKKYQWKTGPFTDEEKELILSALHSHGPNVDKIAPLITSRSREQVRDFLTAWYRRVKKVPVVLSKRDRHNALIKIPIELWLDKIRKETADPAGSNEDNLQSPWLPYILDYIAKYEKHPDPSVTGGVDFRKLYEFLASAVNGNLPQDLSFAESVFILSSLRKLKLRLEKVKFHNDEIHLRRSAMGPATEYRSYIRIKKEDPDSVSDTIRQLENFLSSKMVNPLKMPMETLSIKERVKNQLNI